MVSSCQNFGVISTCMAREGCFWFKANLHKCKLRLSHPAFTKTCYLVQRYGSCEVEFCFNSSNFHETCGLYSVCLVFRRDASGLNGKIECESRVACFFTLSIPMDWYLSIFKSRMIYCYLYKSIKCLPPFVTNITSDKVIFWWHHSVNYITTWN